MPANQVPITQNLDALRRGFNAALALTTTHWNVAAFNSSATAFGTSDDTLTWEAALASGEPLWCPPGVTKVSTLALPNACSIQGARGKSIVQSLPDGLPLLTLSNAYNTMITVQGLVLLGNAGAQPNTGTHRGVYFNNAYSGVDDALYTANSPIGAQVPYHMLDLDIANFNDEGFYVLGAGGSTYRLRIYGTRIGVRANSYDIHFMDCDVGNILQQGWLFEGNGSILTVTGGKTWYTGQGQVSGSSAGMQVSYGAGVTVSGHIIQDTAGSALQIIGNGSGENLCSFTGMIQRQGGQSWFDPATTADIDLRGSSGNVIVAQISYQNNIVQPTYIVNNGTNGAVAAGTGNVVIVTPNGYAAPSPTNTVQIGGTWDGNSLTMGGAARAPTVWLPNDSGDVIFAVNGGGSSTGIIARGPNSLADPGQLIALAESGGGSLQGFSNTATAASQVFTATANLAVGDQVDIAGVVYSAVAAVTNTTANQFKVGASQAATLANLHHAINRAGGVPGTDWSLATAANPAVTATDNGANTVTVTAQSTGAGGNSIVTTTTSAHGSWGAGTLAGGANGVQTYTTSLSWTQSGMSSRPYLQASTTYATDAAAAAGGVPVGGEYRNGSVEQVRIT